MTVYLVSMEPVQQNHVGWYAEWSSKSKKCLHLRCNQVMTQLYATEMTGASHLCPRYHWFMATLFMYVLYKCIPTSVGLFLLLIWLLHPPLPTTTKHLYNPADTSNYISQEIWHTSSQFNLYENNDSGSETRPASPQKGATRTHCQAGMKWLLFHKKKTKNNAV